MYIKRIQSKDPDLSRTRQTMLSAVLWFFLMIFFFASCEKQQGEPSYMGYNYFGLEEGNWIIYDVDSTVYDDFLGEVFHYQYQVMEINAEIFMDAEREESMRLERFIREDEGQQWEEKNIWSSKINRSYALRSEENVTFMKMIFPAKINQTWNGNAYNHYNELNYTITEIHEPFETSNLLFDSTLTVMQNDFETLISKELQYEKFATGIGMIYKKFTELEKEIDGTIVRGVDYTYTIRDHGTR